MGNLLSARLGSEDYKLLGGDLWRKIVSFLPTNDILKSMLICKWFARELNHIVIWHSICLKFHDYERLEFMKSTSGLTWHEICKIRKMEIFKKCEMLIGDQESPKSMVMIHLRGDGSCYMGYEDANYKTSEIGVIYKTYKTYKTQSDKFPHITYTMRTIDESEKILECKPAKTLKSFIPFTEDYKAKKDYAQAITTLNNSYFIDIAAFSPTVLFLSRYGEVLETLFFPSGTDLENIYISFRKPRLINFPSGSQKKIVYIKAMDLGNFAIACTEINGTKTRQVYFWTIYRKASVENSVVNFEERRLESKPVHLEPLDRFNIQRIEESPLGEQYVRMYYFVDTDSAAASGSATDKKENFIDVMKSQIYQLMLEHENSE